MEEGARSSGAASYFGGKLLRELRERQGEWQGKVAYGLCSKAHYSKVENMETEPDIFMLQVFFERLGQSLGKFGTSCSFWEYTVLDQRDRITSRLLEGNWEEIEEELDEYWFSLRESGIKKGREKLHIQFTRYARAVLWQQVRQCDVKAQGWGQAGSGQQGVKRQGVAENREAGALREELLETLHLTVPGFRQEAVQEHRYGRQELAILILLAEAECCEGQLEEGLRLYQEILRYMEGKIPDDRERAVLYPETAARLGEWLLRAGRSGEVIPVCQEGIRLLHRVHRMNGLERLLSCILEGGRRCGNALEGTELYEEEVLALAALREKWEPPGSWSAYPLYRPFYHGQIIGEQLRRARLSLGITMEELSWQAGCSARALENMERGEAKPSAKHYRKLMRSLGLGECRYYPCVHTESYEWYEAVERLKSALEGMDYGRAEQELCGLEAGLDLGEVVNRQFLVDYRAIIEAETGRISREEEQRLLWQAFHMTVPEGLEDISLWPMSEAECFILNHIAISLESRGSELQEPGLRKEAIELLEKVRRRYEIVPGELWRYRGTDENKTFARSRQEYRKNGMNPAFHAPAYLIVVENLVNLIGSDGRYEEALALADQVFGLAYRGKRSYVVLYLLYEKAWNQEKVMEREKREAAEIRQVCQPLFRQAYLIAAAVGRVKRMEFINKRCNDKYRDWWEISHL